MHEINVTPFIDAMVAVRLATVDILVNLSASTADPQPRPDRPLYLTVKFDLTLPLGDDSVSRDLLPSGKQRGAPPSGSGCSFLGLNCASCLMIMRRRSIRHRPTIMMPSALLCTAVVGVGVLSNRWSFLFKEPSSVLKGGEQG